MKTVTGTHGIWFWLISDSLGHWGCASPALGLSFPIGDLKGSKEISSRGHSTESLQESVFEPLQFWEHRQCHGAWKMQALGPIPRL